jgi:peptide/nickel transport system substrate-binding protein
VSRLKQLILAASLAVLSGCADAGSACTEACGTAVFMGPEPDALFPPVAQQDAAIAISDLVFQKLADIGPALSTAGDTGFAPGIAASWTRVNPTTIRFTLDARARWHDGRPVTARDVTFTFDVYLDTLVNSPVRPLLAQIAEVTAPESLTVEFRFRSTYAEQLFDAVYHMRILPQHLLDTVARGSLATHAFVRSPVGSGPFRFVRWTPGQYVELAADTGFFQGRPGLARVIWQIGADPAAMVTRLVAGEADVMPQLGVPENVDRVRQAPHLRVMESAPSFYSYIGFNLRYPGDRSRPHPLFSDRDLRRAISMAVDRHAVVKALFGEEARPGNGPLSHAVWIYSDSNQALPFDTAAARRLLHARGWTARDRDGVLTRGSTRLEFELLVPVISQPRRRAAVIIQEQLRRLGIGMSITEVDLNLFVSRGPEGRFDALFGAWSQDPSPRSIEQSWGTAGLGGFNYQGYSSPVFDRLVREAIGAPDLVTARQRWHRAIAHINDDAPAIWVYSIRPLAGVHRRFRNAVIRPDQLTALLWTWSVHPDSTLPRDRVMAH